MIMRWIYGVERSGTEKIQRGAPLRRRAQRPTHGILQEANHRGSLNKL